MCVHMYVCVCVVFSEWLTEHLLTRNYEIWKGQETLIRNGEVNMKALELVPFNVGYCL
jgi:hypothetical protein